MKKLISIATITAIILSINTSGIFASEKTELETKEYVKTLKTFVKKEGFDEIKNHHGDFSLIKTIKVGMKGMDLAYIEPTIETINDNINRTEKLITFLENNKTDNDKINSISDEMLVYLGEMLSDLQSSHTEYSNQLGFSLDDKQKKNNLAGIRETFSMEEQDPCAYDYINHYNSRVEKIEDMYKYIKDIS